MGRDDTGVDSQDQTRRTFAGTVSTLAMGAGLVAAYGTLAGFMGRFLYPAHGG